MTADTHHPARFWHQEGSQIVCDVCPRHCRLADGQHGFCFVRKNEGGELVLEAYGRPSAVAVDPIEKKPLFHFLPGSSILSLGTAGCNLACRFCQNWDLSRARSIQRGAMELPPESVPELCERHGAASVAFTYNDPSVFPEYAIDIARVCREQGIGTVAVTAGYIDSEARKALYEVIDAANIDLKGFSDDFYRKLSLASLSPVLDTIEHAVKHGVWVELTTLLIPGENDSDEMLGAEARWIVERLGRDVPLHLTAFHPDYKMLDVPATPPETLRRARDIARAEGLRYVYTGNVIDPEGETTRCHACGKALIERRWFSVESNALVGTNQCPHCKATIPGVFDRRSRARSNGVPYGIG
jgi:pyruvate formate lyase activating enzyme